MQNELPTHKQAFFYLEVSRSDHYWGIYIWLKSKHPLNAPLGRKRLTSQTRVQMRLYLHNYCVQYVGTDAVCKVPNKKTASPYVASGMYDCEKLKLFFGLLPLLKARAPPWYFENTTVVIFLRGTSYVNTSQKLCGPKYYRLVWAEPKTIATSAILYLIKIGTYHFTVEPPVVGRLDMYRTMVLMYRTMVLMVCLTKVRC